MIQSGGIRLYHSIQFIQDMHVQMKYTRVSKTVLINAINDKVCKLSSGTGTGRRL